MDETPMRKGLLNMCKMEKKHIFSPEILDEDLVIVKKVSAERHDEYIAAIEAREIPIANHWRDILISYFSDKNAPPNVLQRVRQL